MALVPPGGEGHHQPQHRSVRPFPLTPRPSFVLKLTSPFSTSAGLALLAPNSYRFSLYSPTAVLGLPIGQHIQIQATIGEKVVTRSYTPTSGDDDKGHFDLVVKTYEKGNISKYLQDRKYTSKALSHGLE
jgi:hypothetical protein